jgi:hypothetical protein
MKILQNIRSGMYDENGEAEGTNQNQVPWPRSYTKAKQLPDKFLRTLLPRMEPDRLSEVVFWLMFRVSQLFFGFFFNKVDMTSTAAGNITLGV